MTLRSLRCPSAEKAIDGDTEMKNSAKRHIFIWLPFDECIVYSQGIVIREKQGRSRGRQTIHVAMNGCQILSNGWVKAMGIIGGLYVFMV